MTLRNHAKRDAHSCFIAFNKFHMRPQKVSLSGIDMSDLKQSHFKVPEWRVRKRSHPLVIKMKGDPILVPQSRDGIKEQLTNGVGFAEMATWALWRCTARAIAPGFVVLEPHPQRGARFWAWPEPIR